MHAANNTAASPNSAKVEMPPTPTLNKETIEAMNRIESFITNTMLSRGSLFAKLFDRKRDVDEECGYPREITPDIYQQYYDRDPIAARVCEVFPKEAWQVQPQIYESEDPKVCTPFEESWDRLGSYLRGEKSHYKEEEGSLVYEYLKRANIVSNIGQYGIILIGINDGLPLDRPAFVTQRTDSVQLGAEVQYYVNIAGARGYKKQEDAKEVTDNFIDKKEVPNRRVIYLRVFSEAQAPVTAYEVDPTNPRFGQPVTYLITFTSPINNSANLATSMATVTKTVHWTRVVHIPSSLGTSESLGIPTMQQVINNLYNLKKLYGGSAEMYWAGAFPGISFETIPQLGAEPVVDVPSLKDMYEQYRNGLQRALFLMGMTAKTLSPTVVDPTPQIKAQLEAICIKLGVPMRIFLGSERGELASSQDDAAWNDRVKEYENGHVTPRILIPFIDRLIALHVLAIPKTGFKVEWPDLTSKSDAEKAVVATQLTQALVSYVQSGAESLVPPMQFFTLFMKMTDEEALSMLHSAAKEAQGTSTAPNTESPLLGLVGGITGMIELFKLAKDGGLTEAQLKEQIKLFFKVDDVKASQLIADGLQQAPELNPGLDTQPQLETSLGA